MVKIARKSALAQLDSNSVVILVRVGLGNLIDFENHSTGLFAFMATVGGIPQHY